MGYLLFILFAWVLFGGFFVVREYEARRGARYFAPKRDQFDQTIERLQFILGHVDFGAFLRDEIRRLFGRLSHAVVHISLQIVRAMERVLTRLVRYLRSKHSVDAVPNGSVREFVKTLSDFKGKLKTTHPEVTDIQ